MDLNGVEYYYIRNAQRDVIGLFDKTGTQVVSYTYDTWGKLISTTGSLASTVGVKNPYLYRGYRYDTETGLYYLQSRYYSPDWGRFINADATGGKVGDLLSSNVFSYCKNNPVNMSDPSGHWGFWSVLAVVAVIIVAIAFLPEEVLAATVVTVVGAGEELLQGGEDFIPQVEEVAPKMEQVVEKVSKAKNLNIDKGINFASKAEQHMGNPVRQVPVQTLTDAIKSVKGIADPRGSDALMHYTTMFKSGNQYNLEVLYNGSTNTIYHFEYARKAMGPSIKILKP